MKPRRPDFELEPVSEVYVETPQQLDRLVARLRDAPRIAVDTEFVRDRQYVPALELVQLATDDVLAVVDYRRLRDISPLLTLFHTEAILKVVHAGRQDLEIFYNLTHRVPSPVFDTQVAAAVLGLGSQLGYANMVDRLLGVTLSNSQARTNWSQRPLTDEQIAYALDDVRYLLPLHDELQRRLDAKGRLSWFIEEMAKHTEARRFAHTEPREVWRKIDGISRMTPQQLAVLREVTACREEIARRHDRALPFVASDNALKTLARRQPKTVSHLYKISGLRKWSITTYGEEILAAVARGARTPPEQRPRYEPDMRPLTEDEAALVDLLEALVRIRAEELNVDQSTLACRDELRELVLANGDADAGSVALLNGWRREIIGEDLLALVAGKAGLIWNPVQGRLEIR